MQRILLVRINEITFFKIYFNVESTANDTVIHIRSCLFRLNSNLLQMSGKHVIYWSTLHLD